MSPPKDDLPSISDAVSAFDTYTKMADFLSGVTGRLVRAEPVTYDEIEAQVENLLAETKEHPDQTQLLIEVDTPEDYPVGHMVCVCILALRMGMELNFSHEKLMTMGIGASLFDVGMIKLLDIASVGRNVSPLEFDEVRKHPEYSVNVIRQIKGMPEAAVEIAMQHHERPDGKGYPYGLRAGQISELAKVVMLADVYVALTHSRPKRAGVTPHDAIKELLQGPRLFSPHVLKALLRVITVYPIGTWVELNSRDVGRVVKLNHEQPLRPIIEVVCDYRGQRMESKNVVNLNERPQLYITGVVEKDHVKKWGLDELVLA
ncbi:MAG: HD domain-containing phosphohydrolase [Pseudomonadota bacterium]